MPGHHGVDTSDLDGGPARATLAGRDLVRPGAAVVVLAARYRRERQNGRPRG